MRASASTSTPTPHSCARVNSDNPDDGAPAIRSDGTVTGILPSDGHTRVP